MAANLEFKVARRLERFKLVERVMNSHRRRLVLNEFQFLQNFEPSFVGFDWIKSAHRRYVADVSSTEMAVSLNTVCLLLAFCEKMQPSSILDLGSGFSSFALRSYARQKHDVKVYSVDDNQEWLRKTGDFLSASGLSTKNLMTWDEFRKSDLKDFELVFHDLGSMELRAQALPDVLGRVKPASGVLILDDMHKPDYACFVGASLQGRRLNHLNLKPFTIDEIGRYAHLVTGI